MLNLDKICRFQSESNSIIMQVFEIALQYQFLEYFHGSDKEKWKLWYLTVRGDSCPAWQMSAQNFGNEKRSAG